MDFGSLKRNILFISSIGLGITCCTISHFQDSWGWHFLAYAAMLPALFLIIDEATKLPRK